MIISAIELREIRLPLSTFSKPVLAAPPKDALSLFA